MTTYSVQQVTSFAANAGFTGNGLKSIVAIAYAESGFNDHPTDNVNTDAMHSRDRGILQINSYWHSEVTDACAYNPTCAFKAAYTISSNGTNFKPWSTYNGPMYNSFLSGNSIIGTINLGAVSIPANIATSNTSGFNTSFVEPTTTVKESTSGYRYILAYGIAIALFIFTIKSRVGYTAMYYMLVLTLLFIVLVESKFIAASLSPLTGGSKTLVSTTNASGQTITF